MDNNTLFNGILNRRILLYLNNKASKSPGLYIRCPRKPNFGEYLDVSFITNPDSRVDSRVYLFLVREGQHPS